MMTAVCEAGFAELCTSAENAGRPQPGWGLLHLLAFSWRLRMCSSPSSSKSISRCWGGQPGFMAVLQGEVPREACDPQGKGTSYLKPEKQTQVDVKKREEACMMGCKSGWRQGESCLSDRNSTVAFGPKPPVVFGTRDEWQLEAAVERLQQKTSRLTWSSKANGE